MSSLKELKASVKKEIMDRITTLPDGLVVSVVVYETPDARKARIEREASEAAIRKGIKVARAQLQQEAIARKAINMEKRSLALAQASKAQITPQKKSGMVWSLIG